MIRRLFARLFRRDTSTAKPASPVEAFDQMIEALEHRAAALRQSAASMVSVRSGLERTHASQLEDRAALQSRLEEARVRSDAALIPLIERELETLERSITTSAAQVARAQADAAELLEQLSGLQRQLEGLRRERAEAALVVDAGRTLIEAEQSSARLRVDHALALDAARDEVARVEALVAIQREDAKG